MNMITIIIQAKNKYQIFIKHNLVFETEIKIKFQQGITYQPYDNKTAIYLFINDTQKRKSHIY